MDKSTIFFKQVQTNRQTVKTIST